VKHILELVEAIPDARWRLAFQLLAAYGLRPEELQHLQLRGGRLWCSNYRKNTSRGATKPRPLRQQYEAEGKKLVLYSARHGYAHRAHMICELPPKVAAAAMGHSVETHLSVYSKWCGDDVVDDAFKRAATRLGR